MKTVQIKDITVGGGKGLFVLAGPCVIEDYDRTLAIGKRAKEICERLGVPYIFKASFDKANRSSFSSFRGPGLEEGLKMLASIKKELNVPVVSDIHSIEQIEPAAEVLDILQIPAFLCRQTDLVYGAAKTGKCVNVKKGQFMAPKDMENVLNKMKETGNENLMLTERGFSFGYNNLVVDMRSFPIMRSFDYPVIFDATHSVQLPGGAGTKSSGNREFVPNLARAAVASGVDGLFFEVHDNPEEALSDGPNMLYLDQFEDVLRDLVAIDKDSEFVPHYTSDGKYFYHELSPYVSLRVAPHSSAMTIGKKYYSTDGIHFDGFTIENPFLFRNLTKPSNYSAAELDKVYSSMNIRDSRLAGKGAIFKEAEERYGVNALYLMAHSALESAWGRSQIAKDKNNFFGIAAYDSSPYTSAKKFDDVDKGILGAAKWIRENYIDRGRDHLGNKATGMNVLYASDPYWGEKIASIMMTINSRLGGKD